jgi:RecQ family ATP-dependent DNA helicase
MIQHLCEKHIDLIKGTINEGLVVYKGFPIEFLLKLSLELPFITDTSKLIENGKINLKFLSNNKNEMISSFLKFAGIRIATYEEFTLVCRNVNPEILNYDIVIVDNSLFKDFYLNPSNIQFPDLLQEVENNDDFDPNPLMNEFYANSQILGGSNFISYYDLNINDSSKLKRLDFYEKLIANKELKLEYTSGDEDLIELPSSDNTFSTIKSTFYEGKPKRHLNFIVSDRVNSPENENIKRDLLILQLLGNLQNIDIKVYPKIETFKKTIRKSLYNILLRYWKSENFRILSFYEEPDFSDRKVDISQGQIIENIVKQCELAQSNQKFRDIFITAPTGSGKSLLFQIPAIYLADNYCQVTIIVSPLKALMYDQVVALQNRGIDTACFINSDISFVERQEAIELLKNGQKSILYLSPELLLSYNISEFIGERKVGLIIIDEAHLVSTWGRDFRVDYWFLGKYIRNLRKYTNQRFPVVALTATAVYSGENDIVFQTIESLNMQLPKLYIGNTRRDDIHFQINTYKYTGNHEEAKIRKTKERIENNINNAIKSIFYFPWIRQIEATVLNIEQSKQSKIGRYYGNVDKYERQDVMNRFKTGEIQCILATKAFGMGIDIGDILDIYHHAPSGDLSDYVQEIGRVARDESLEGRATVDFAEKDLKFAKILYGLSSVKQYQVKLVLQKIFEIFQKKKKQNLLFSIEDFQYLFPDAKDVESKVKSSLLLLENDLLNKFGYYVIIVRPKSLYSTVFAEIPKKIEKKFLSNYGEYCQKVPKPQLNNTYTVSLPAGITKTSRGTENNFFIMKLDKLWEKYFSNESFPRVKKRFFDRKLFYDELDDNPMPLCKLTITLNKSVDETFKLLEDYWTILRNTFQDLIGHYFTRNEFENALKTSIPSRILRKRIVDLILSTYSSRIQVLDTNESVRYDNLFLQVRTKSNIPQYRVINNKFYRTSKTVIRKFLEMFSLSEPFFEKYLSPQSKLEQVYIKMAHLIESFQLGSYEFAGGILPQVFVRINDPFKIRLLANDESYSNDILQDINNRHRSSMLIMEKFFTANMDTTQRWDFIENYFLGKDVLAEMIDDNQ